MELTVSCIQHTSESHCVEHIVSYESNQPLWNEFELLRLAEGMKVQWEKKLDFSSSGKSKSKWRVLGPILISSGLFFCHKSHAQQHKHRWATLNFLYVHRKHFSQLKGCQQRQRLKDKWIPSFVRRLYEIYKHLISPATKHRPMRAKQGSHRVTGALFLKG